MTLESEFPFIVSMLSWVGKQEKSTVRCCLYRVIGNDDWHEKFRHSSIQYLQLWGSHHRPVLANILAKPFRAKKKNFNLTSIG